MRARARAGRRKALARGRTRAWEGKDGQPSEGCTHAKIRFTRLETAELIAVAVTHSRRGAQKGCAIAAPWRLAAPEARHRRVASQQLRRKEDARRVRSARSFEGQHSSSKVSDRKDTFNFPPPARRLLLTHKLL
ncbi:Protein of unknown function [Gryllus bimaculatus]|nr:Protein of unknown function [Gryllus bimaculatus]